MMSWAVPQGALVEPGAYLACAMAASAFVGLSKAGFGGGVGALATPLLLLILPGPTALSVMLPVLLACDVMTLRKFPRAWDRRAFWSLAPWMFLGLFAGLGLLVVFARMGSRGDLLIRLAVGVVVVSLTASARLLRPVHGGGRRLWLSAAVGLSCGVTTMVAHAAGVLLNLFLLGRRLRPAAFVGTATRFYLTFNLVKIPFFIAATPLAGREFLTWTNAAHSLWLIPAGYVGVAAGAWLNRRLPPKRYLEVVNVLLLATGGYLVLASLLGLAAHRLH